MMGRAGLCDLGEPEEILLLLEQEGLGCLVGIDEAGRGPLAGPVVAAAVCLPPGCRLPGVTDSKQLSPQRREECLPRILEAAQRVGVGIVPPEVIDRINILQATYQAMGAALQQAFTPRPGCPTLQDGLTSGMEHAARLEDALGAPGAPLPPEITGQRDVPPSAGPAAAVARGASLPQEAAGQCDSVLQWDALGAALVLVDGRPVPGLGRRQVALVKGDSRSLCIAAASIVAKVTRDHLMREAHDLYPHYGFAHHQGYPTPAHLEALRRHGPCPLHRRSFGPVRALLGVVEGDLYGKGSDSCG